MLTLLNERCKDRIEPHQQVAAPVAFGQLADAWPSRAEIGRICSSGSTLVPTFTVSSSTIFTSRMWL